MMHYPRDGETLRRTVAAPGAIVWACARCNGRAIAMPVLRRQASADAARDLWRHVLAAKPLAAAGSVCPACRLDTVNAPLVLGDVTVELDVCTSCHLVWFDAGEEQGLSPVREPETRGDAAKESHEGLAARDREDRRRGRGYHVWASRGMQPPLLFDVLEIGEWRGLTLATAAAAAIVALVTIVGWVDQEWLSVAWFPAHLLVGCFWADWSALASGIAGLVVHLVFFAALASEVEDRHGPWRWLALLTAAAAVSTLVDFLRAPEFVPAFGLPAIVTAMVVLDAMQQRQWPTRKPHIVLLAWLVAVYFCNAPFWCGPLWFEGPGWYVLPAHLCGALAGLLAGLAWREPTPR